MFSSCSRASSVSTYGIGWSLMVFCFPVRRTAPRQPVCCGGFFSTIQFSNISSDLRYEKDPTGIRSFGQSTLTKRSSYFHIRWLRHFPKVNLYPISGLAGEESTHQGLQNSGDDRAGLVQSDFSDRSHAALVRGLPSGAFRHFCRKGATLARTGLASCTRSFLIV